MSEEVVTIAFRDKGGSPAHILLHWQQGRRLRQYLRDPGLRGQSLLARALRARVLNQDRRKLRLTDVLSPGDTVHIVPTKRI